MSGESLKITSKTLVSSNLTATTKSGEIMTSYCCSHMKRGIKQGMIVKLLQKFLALPIPSGSLTGGCMTISYCPWCGKKINKWVSQLN